MEGLDVSAAACGTAHWGMGDHMESILAVKTYGSAYEVVIWDFWVSRKY